MKLPFSLNIIVSMLLSAPIALHSAADEMAKNTPGLATAVFAGGCFWCTEADFEQVDGVVEAISGYTAGQTKNPTYKQVTAGTTGHTEAVKVIYDSTKVTYPQLLEVYWRSIDPTVRNRQFCDVGSQYRTGIYYDGEAQKEAAQASLDQLKASGRFKTIYTEVEPLNAFYDAESYHQNYYKENPVRYKIYRYRCGRDQRLEDIWK